MFAGEGQTWGSYRWFSSQPHFAEGKKDFCLRDLAQIRSVMASVQDGHFLSLRLCCCWVAQSCPTLCDPMDCSPHQLLRPWDSPGKNPGVGCHFLLQGIFPTWDRTCIGRQILYYWAAGKPYCKESTVSKGLHLDAGDSHLSYISLSAFPTIITQNGVASCQSEGSCFPLPADGPSLFTRCLISCTWPLPPCLYSHLTTCLLQLTTPKGN